MGRSLLLLFPFQGFQNSCTLKNCVQHLVEYVRVLEEYDGPLVAFKDLEPELQTKSLALQQCLEDCCAKTESSLLKTNYEIEEETANLNEKETRIKSMETKMKKSELSIVSKKILIEEEENREQKYKNELHEAKNNLCELRKKKEEYETNEKKVLDVSMVISFIPIINIIAEPVSAAFLEIYKMAREEIQKRIDIAYLKISKCEENIKAANLSLDEILSAKTKMENEKSCLEKGIGEAEEAIKALKQEQRKHLDLQEILQKSLKLVSEMHGKASVLHSETKGGYSIEPLLLPLKELIVIVSGYERFLSTMDCKMLREIEF